MERKVESKIRKRFDQLYDDLTDAGYDEEDIEDVLNEVEDQLISELDDFEVEDEDDET